MGLPDSSVRRSAMRSRVTHKLSCEMGFWSKYSRRNCFVHVYNEGKTGESSEERERIDGARRDGVVTLAVSNRHGR